MTTVAVCVVTFRRPALLAQLLASIAHLRVDDDVHPRLVVIDNDAAASAREPVMDAAAALSFPVHYRIEPHRGLATARNAALVAAGDVDAIAFLDDDERPDPDWLAELLAVQRSTDADIVMGPVLPIFDDTSPAWVREGDFFGSRRFPTGTRLDWANAGNVLMTASVFAGHRLRFDPRYDLSGGEDTHFFMRATDAGLRTVWADDAIARERVHPDRVRLRWLVRREYRRGNTLSLCVRDLDPRPARVLRRTVHGLVRVTVGGSAVAVAPLRGRGARCAFVRGLRQMSFGAGLLTGLLGLRYLEYSDRRLGTAALREATL